jgi:hypothetical protein
MADELTAWHEALTAYPLLGNLHSLCLSFDVAGCPSSSWAYPTHRRAFLRCPDLVPPILTKFTKRIAGFVERGSEGRCRLEFEGEEEVVHALLHPRVFWAERR